MNFEPRPNNGIAITFSNRVIVSIVPDDEGELAEIMILRPYGVTSIPRNITKEYDAEKYNGGIIPGLTADEIADAIQWAKSQ